MARSASVGLDQRHHRRDRQGGNERARSQRQVDHVAVAGRAHGGLVKVPLRRLELRSDLRDLRVFPVHLGTEFLLHLIACRGRLRLRRPRLRLDAAGRVQLPLELLEVGLGLS